MIRTMIVAGASALCLAPLAQADHDARYGYEGYNVQYAAPSGNCARERDDNRMAGAVVGAVAGGLLGAAIADGDDHYHRRGRGHYRRHYYRRHSDGDEVAGAVIGGILGAVVGSEIAADNTDCNPRAARYAYDNIAPPTRQPFAQSGPYRTTAPQQPTYAPPPQASQPVNNELYGGPNDGYGDDYPAQPVRITRTGPEPVQSCQTLMRETRLPDGNIVQEPVTMCQDASGQWVFQDQDAQY
ncbi:MAG: glycine zipper 2TM domain-containing protein [Alphaproteobacteria bacterium]|nr:glycine zipper 2TM domain-containing protein [Alphaproteobacteria bacterium]